MPSYNSQNRDFNTKSAWFCIYFLNTDFLIEVYITIIFHFLSCPRVPVRLVCGADESLRGDGRRVTVASFAHAGSNPSRYGF